MILDNEEQRKLLLQIISNTPINGNFVQAREAVRMLDELSQAIITAKISKEADVD